MSFNLVATKKTAPHNSNLFSNNDVLKLAKEFFINSFQQGNLLCCDDVIYNIADELDLYPNDNEYFESFKIWFRNISSLAYIENIINNDNISEILVHNNEKVQIQTSGDLKDHHVEELSKEDFQLSLEILCFNNNKEWNYSNPFVSFTSSILNNYFRITLIHFSATPKKNSKLFLRRQNHNVFDLDDYLVPKNVFDFLSNAIKLKKNILVSGATGSGKTSFMNTLLGLIPTNEHVIILEDTYELYSSHFSRTSLLSKQDIESKTLKTYCAHSLRMRPDRIVLGEIRSDEIVPFILSMNNGHKGLMSTIHANSAIDSLSRMALLFQLYSGIKDISYETIYKLLCTNIDYIIHLENRKVSEIISIIGSENSNPFFEIEYSHTF